MRRRLQPLRARAMARRSGGEEGYTLSPRARWIGGWVVAVLLIVGIAVVVGVLGGNGDGDAILPDSSASTAPQLPAIEFGTALDPATGRVAADARTTRFAEDDLFVYSVPPSGTVPDAVYVEVMRANEAVPVQEAVEAQRLPNPEVIAFQVPADNLFAVFGPGDYVMRIYADPDGDPIAEGEFQLVGPDASPPASS